MSVILLRPAAAGIDLMPEFCAVVNEISRLAGLAHRTRASRLAMRWSFRSCGIAVRRGMHLVPGEQAVATMGNSARNADAGRIVFIQGVFGKP